jgi:hypothetical protein
MPINIYRNDSSKEESKIAWLCDDSWSLSEQMYALEDWLKEKDGRKGSVQLFDSVEKVTREFFVSPPSP